MPRPTWTATTIAHALQQAVDSGQIGPVDSLLVGVASEELAAAVRQARGYGAALLQVAVASAHRWASLAQAWSWLDALSSSKGARAGVVSALGRLGADPARMMALVDLESPRWVQPEAAWALGLLDIPDEVLEDQLSRLEAVILREPGATAADAARLWGPEALGALVGLEGALARRGRRGHDRHSESLFLGGDLEGLSDVMAARTLALRGPDAVAPLAEAVLRDEHRTTDVRKAALDLLTQPGCRWPHPLVLEIADDASHFLFPHARWRLFLLEEAGSLPVSSGRLGLPWKALDRTDAHPGAVAEIALVTGVDVGLWSSGAARAALGAGLDPTHRWGRAP